MDNLYDQVDEEINFFAQKFTEAGWTREDDAYLYKDVGFDVHPDAANEEWKTKASLTLFPELLSYTENSKYILSPWLACKISVANGEGQDERLKELTSLLVKDIESFGFKTFYDEDAPFGGKFVRPEEKENMGSYSTRCYINKDYPNGYWENHTLD